MSAPSTTTTCTVCQKNQASVRGMCKSCYDKLRSRGELPIKYPHMQRQNQRKQSNFESLCGTCPSEIMKNCGFLVGRPVATGHIPVHPNQIRHIKLFRENVYQYEYQKQSFVILECDRHAAAR